MYRAIPEVSRICSLQERSRQYKLHMEALQKIKNQKPSNRSASAQSNLAGNPLRKRSSKREEQKRITYENQKMYNAILYRPNFINHYDFIAHERDHMHQVNRMTSMRHTTYGFENPNKTRKSRSYADEFEFKQEKKAQTQGAEISAVDPEKLPKESPEKPVKNAPQKQQQKVEKKNEPMPEKKPEPEAKPVVNEAPKAEELESIKDHVDDVLDGDEKKEEENVSMSLKKEIGNDLKEANEKKDDDNDDGKEPDLSLKGELKDNFQGTA